MGQPINEESNKRIKMKEYYLIIVPQEYERANHKMLWHSMGIYANTIIVDISADLFVSVLRKKIYRITESFKKKRKVSENVWCIRPFFLIRPEILGGFFDTYITIVVERSLKKKFP